MQQFPLLATHALTAHRMQGQTVACLWVGATRASGSPRYLYVACSRVRSFDGLSLLQKLPSNPLDKCYLLPEDVKLESREWHRRLRLTLYRHSALFRVFDVHVSDRHDHAPPRAAAPASESAPAHVSGPAPVVPSAAVFVSSSISAHSSGVTAAASTGAVCAAVAAPPPFVDPSVAAPSVAPDPAAVAASTLSVFRVCGDGHCMFRALATASDGVLASDSRVIYLRAVVAEQLHARWAYYYPLLLHDPPDARFGVDLSDPRTAQGEYLRYILTIGWGGLVELGILAAHLAVRPYFIDGSHANALSRPGEERPASSQVDRNCVLLWFHGSHWDLLARVSPAAAGPGGAPAAASAAAGLPCLVQTRFTVLDLEHQLSSSTHEVAISRSVAAGEVYCGPPRGGDTAARSRVLVDWSRAVPLRRSLRQDLSLPNALLARIRPVPPSASPSEPIRPAAPAAAAGVTAGVVGPSGVQDILRYVTCMRFSL